MEDEKDLSPPEAESPDRKPLPQRRSRIPLLMSEEETGSDKSSQMSQEQLQRTRKSRQHQLARLVLERKHTHLIRSRSASSQSPTPSTTASEDETHQSDDSARGERGADGKIRSRIPRPVTPIRGSSNQLGGTTLPQTQRSVSFIQYRWVEQNFNLNDLNLHYQLKVWTHGICFFLLFFLNMIILYIYIFYLHFLFTFMFLDLYMFLGNQTV